MTNIVEVDIGCNEFPVLYKTYFLSDYQIFQLIKHMFLIWKNVSWDVLDDLFSINRYRMNLLKDIRWKDTVKKIRDTYGFVDLELFESALFDWIKSR